MWNAYGRRDERGVRARGGWRKKETRLGMIIKMVEGEIRGSLEESDLFGNAGES